MSVGERAEGLAGAMPPGCPWAVSSAARPLAALRFAATLDDARRLADRLFVYGRARVEHALSGECWERERRRWRQARAGAAPPGDPAGEETPEPPWWVK